MPADRGAEVDHVSPFRWAQRFAPELEKRTRRHLPPCRGTGHADAASARAGGGGRERRARRRLRPWRGTWHGGETCARVGGGWRYLYRAVDGSGQTIYFLLGA